MRDRLIALLRQRSCIYMPCDGDCGDCKNIEMFDEDIEQLADHLLANGVIIRERGEWITPWVMKPYGKAYGTPYCSVCKQMDGGKGNFCGFCGADMRGEENG